MKTRKIKLNEMFAMPEAEATGGKKLTAADVKAKFPDAYAAVKRDWGYGGSDPDDFDYELDSKNNLTLTPKDGDGDTALFDKKTGEIVNAQDYYEDEA